MSKKAEETVGTILAYPPELIKIVSDNEVVAHSVHYNNPRTLTNPGFSQERMEALRLGIQQDGLNVPLLVRRQENIILLIAGERRLRTILYLKEHNLPCFNQRTEKEELARVVYETVDCKVVPCVNEKDAIRRAVLDNTLHEPLSEYELLLQVDKLERSGCTRAEQAVTLGMSEAWISQSHSLLEGESNILLRHMEEGKLTRTAAITFLPIQKADPSKVELVLKEAIRLTYENAEFKEITASHELETAQKDIEDNNAELTIAEFTGDSEGARKSRRILSRAGRRASNAEKKLNAARKLRSRKITVETIAAAAKAVNGTADLHRPQSMKHIRAWVTELNHLLEMNPNEDRIEFNGRSYSRSHIKIQYDLLTMIVGGSILDHPLELL